MPRDIRVARPFQLNGTDGVTYEWGIGYYPQVSDAVANHWYTQWNTQSAVLSRGLGLVQWRWLRGIVNPRGPAMIWLTAEAGYTVDIESGWPIIFRDDLAHFPALSLPPVPDFIAVGVDPVSGKTLYRQPDRSDRIMRSHHSTSEMHAVKIYPGQPSPPIAYEAGANLDRADREEAAHFEQQTAQLRTFQAVNKRYIDAGPDARPIPWPTPRPLSDFTFADPRQ